MLVKAERVAEKLLLSKQRVYSMARQNLFPPGVLIKFGDYEIRFDEERLDQWLSEGGTMQPKNAEQK